MGDHELDSRSTVELRAQADREGAGHTGVGGRNSLSRRAVLLGGAGAGLLLASCTTDPRYLRSDSPAVGEQEKVRKGTGRTTTVDLVAAASSLDLAGVTANTWTFGSLPAPVIRVGAGDTLRARVRNELNDPTSVHWHGLALRNDMDGVPPLTQKPIQPARTFDYEFIAPHPGTYWFHPHVGPQLDHGLYGALIVEDPNEPLSYDDEWVVILDDWLDGVTTTPEQVMAELGRGMSAMGMDGMPMRMGNMLMGATSDLLGGDAGDVYYPYYLINGKPVADPTVFSGTPRSRVRIRIINAGSDTAFRFALGRHRLTVTHTDGFPVEPRDVDTLLLGMGERYDVLVTLADGVFPMVAEAEGKQDRAFAIVRTGGGSAPPADVEVPELARKVGDASGLTASSDVLLAPSSPARRLTISLTGSMAQYDWGINGRRFDAKSPLAGALGVRQGERVQLTVTNDTDMWHPFHLHGHTYQHAEGGPRKDTSIVLPRTKLVVEFDTDNPGVWAAHCHNIYHAEAGMMTVLAYEG